MSGAGRSAAAGLPGTTRVACVTDAAGFRALETEWDALLDRASSRSVFLRWGWLSAWWSAFGKGHDLRLYTARDAGGRLTGIAPLHRRRERAPWPLRVLTFLGTERVSSDYLDFIVDSDAEEETAGALWRAIAADTRGIDSIRFCDLLDSSVVARRVAPAARSAGWSVDARVAEYCPYVALPATFDALLAAIGKSLRDNFRRGVRRLESVGATFDVVDREEEIGDALDALYRLHEARWRRKGREGNFRDDRVRAFHREASRTLAPARTLRLYRIRIGERPIAVLYALEERGVLSYYQAGFEPTPPDPSIRPHDYSPGIVLIGAAIRDAIERGHGEFDFLRGHEPAKFRWTPRYRTTRTLTLHGPGQWRGRLALRAVRAAQAARGAARRLLRRPSLPLPPGAA